MSSDLTNETEKWLQSRKSKFCFKKFQFQKIKNVAIRKIESENSDKRILIGITFATKIPCTL